MKKPKMDKHVYDVLEKFKVKYLLEMDTPTGDVLYCQLKIPRDSIDPQVFKEIFQLGK